MRIFLILFILLSFLAPQASDAGTGKSSAVADVEAYLRNLETAQARFLQTAPDGSQMIGTFYMNRPGKLRFEYDDPVKDFIVADGFFIYFYDSELGEQTNAPIGQTLADFLLRADLKLSGDIAVQNVVQNGTLLLVTLIQAADPDAGSITLGFEEKPMQLKKWRVKDAQGLVTEIELFQLETKVELDDSLFIYINPRRLEDRGFND